MKNFITTLKDIWKIEELKNKIILTLGLIAVYRFMAGVPLPGIDPLQLSALKESTSGGLLGLLNANIKNVTPIWCYGTTVLLLAHYASKVIQIVFR